MKKFVLSVFLIIVLSLLLMITPLFSISEIEVTGNNYYESEQIIKSSEIDVGRNGFLMINGDLKHFISLRYHNEEMNITSKLPYIRSARVFFLPAGKVLITVEEREALLSVEYLDVFLLLDKYGYVVEVIDEEKSSYITAKGLRFNGFELGGKLFVDNPDNLEALISFVGALTKEEKNDKLKIEDYINLIDINDKDNLKLFLDSRIIVNFGQIKDSQYKIRTLKQIFFESIRETEKGMLDFSSGEYPVFMPG